MRIKRKKKESKEQIRTFTKLVSKREKWGWRCGKTNTSSKNIRKQFEINNENQQRIKDKEDEKDAWSEEKPLIKNLPTMQNSSESIKMTKLFKKRISE